MRPDHDNGTGTERHRGNLDGIAQLLFITMQYGECIMEKGRLSDLPPQIYQGVTLAAYSVDV